MIQAQGTTIIVKGTTKKTKIVMDNEEQAKVESMRIFSIGKDCSDHWKVEDDVCILRPILQQTERLVVPDINAEPVKGDFYIAVEEKELIGIYE